MKQNKLAIGHNVGSGLMPEIVNGKVDARAVHEALGVVTPFHTWLKRRIEEFGFREEEDFFPATRTNLYNRTDYTLTLDMAKELAMVERNEKGRQMRRYFIACEKALREGIAPTLPTTALVRIQQINAVLIEEVQGHADRIAELEAHMRPGKDWLTIAEWLAAEGHGKLNSGRVAKLSCLAAQRTAAMGLPMGRKRVNGRERRSFSPAVLDDVCHLKVILWDAKDSWEGGEE